MDFVAALPGGIFEAVGLDMIQESAGSLLLFSGIGLGWICPAVAGFVIGITVHAMHGKS